MEPENEAVQLCTNIVCSCVVFLLQSVMMDLTADVHEFNDFLNARVGIIVFMNAV